MPVSGKNITINVNGISVCYDDAGSGSVPLIFIHGFPFDKSSWQPQVDYFQSSHRVIAYDIRGFGRSTATVEKASIDLFADDLVRFMDALEIDKAILCGLSMGGYIVLNAVSRYAERCEAIILSDTQCIADSGEAKEKRYKTIQHIEAGGLTDFAEGFTKNVFCKESITDKKELIEKIKNIVLSTSTRTITATLQALAQRGETCSILNKISVPALILCGKEDVITPLSQSEFMHANIKNSILKTIDNAGHLSNLEQPGVFNQHVADFISGLKKA